MAELQLLQSFFSLIIASPFLVALFVTFGLVYLTRRILRVWVPDFESNRWFKTLLPIGTLLVATGVGVGLSFIPVFAGSWAIGMLTGFLAGLFLLFVYGTIRNAIRERIKAVSKKNG